MKNAPFDTAITMEKMLKATDPKYNAEAIGLKATHQERIAKLIAEHFKHSDEIYAYIMGKAEIDTILPLQTKKPARADIRKCTILLHMERTILLSAVSPPFP